MERKLFKKQLSMLAILIFAFVVEAFGPLQTVQASQPIAENFDVLAGKNKDTCLQKYPDAYELAKKKASTLTSKYGVTSVQYALIENNTIVMSGQNGYSNKEKGQEPTKDTMYNIGSISKMFTTVAVMQLVEQGKINLDTPVVNYLPEFTMADERYKKITPRMLLNHSSGLMGSCYGNSMLLGENNSYAHDNLLKNLTKQRLKAEPGAFSVYCNDGFTLAEILVEKVTSTPFAKYINKNISAPLKLADTKTPQDSFDRERLAKAYGVPTDKALPFESLGIIGAGGISASAEDLCNFSRIFVKETKGVLSNSSAKAMENKECLNGLWRDDQDSIISYGLGWDSVDTYPYNQYGIKALVKGGDTSLYHGSLVVLPEESMAVAVLSSGGSSIFNEIMANEILLTTLKEKGRISKIITKKNFGTPVKADMPAELKQMEGVYASSGGASQITIDYSGVLTCENKKYTYSENGAFINENGSEYIKFIKENNGNTYCYAGAFMNFEDLGNMVLSTYSAQKLTENKIAENVLEAWKQRNNKKYFIVSDRFSSIVYASAKPWTQDILTDKVMGYYSYAKIINENLAQAQLEIPGLSGRDLMDCNFYKACGKEYLEAADYILISEDALSELSDDNRFTVNIEEDGYAKWYKANGKKEGSSITVTSGKGSTFAVFQKDGSLVYNSYIEGKKSVYIPKDGYAVFIGNKGEKFTVEYASKDK